MAQQISLADYDRLSAQIPGEQQLFVAVLYQAVTDLTPKQARKTGTFLTAEDLALEPYDHGEATIAAHKLEAAKRTGNKDEIEAAAYNLKETKRRLASANARNAKRKTTAANMRSALDFFTEHTHATIRADIENAAGVSIPNRGGDLARRIKHARELLKASGHV